MASPFIALQFFLLIFDSLGGVSCSYDDAAVLQKYTLDFPLGLICLCVISDLFMSHIISCVG